MRKKLIIFIFLLFIINLKSVNAINATSAIVMDIDSNRVLYSKNIHQKRSVASISKIMTAIVSIENIDINKEIIIGDEINNSYGSGIYIKKDEVLTIKDLLYGLMLRSGNDAALALANHVCSSEKEFVELMNNKAKELGMKNTIFNNPSGLEYNGGNISTAYDMAILTSYAMKNDIYKEITNTKKYTLKTNKNTYIWNNKNKLLNLYKYATGGKTGYTEVAKRTLVTTSTKDNLNLVVVTLNDGNDFNDHMDLHEMISNEYNNYLILKKGKINVIEDKLYDYLYIKEDFKYPLLDNEKNNVLLKFELNNKKSEKAGKVIVKLNNEIIHEQEIYSKQIKKRKESIYMKIYRWLFK